MKQLEKVFEVNAPLRAVYNQWTQFEEFPRFMRGVMRVRQIDDTHVHWHAQVWGKDKEWEAEITEQDRDKRISWKSVSGAPNAGTIRFVPVDAGRTQIRVAIAYDPQGTAENIIASIGGLEAMVETTLRQFKHFIEQRGHETGGWRNEVHDSTVASSPGSPTR
jgi:uncharacterized membrane protein